MPERIEVVVCLGSSCFSRGNRKVVTAIQDYLKKYDLEDKVYFHGNHCFSNCSYGPVLKVGEIIYKDVDTLKVIDILDDYFKHSNMLI